MSASQYEFRYFGDNRAAFECGTMAEVRNELRAYCPASTVYRAIGQGDGHYTVLTLSPYLHGPHIAGHLHIAA